MSALRRALASPPGHCGRFSHLLWLAALTAILSAGSCRDALAKKPEVKPDAAKVEVKSKTYTFGALDIEGRLKTPQLLYFLSRMKSEFDNTSPAHRSFIPELKRSAHEM